MAKVSRRAKKEEKKQPEFKVEEVELAQPDKKLSHHELLQVETLPLLLQNSKLDMAVQEQSLANMILEQKLLINKIEKQKAIVLESAQKYQTEKERYNAAISLIMKNHGLSSENFGYNNETGEIIV
jgi:hypothetical protein